MKQDEITFGIIGCAMKVHSVLGNGFQEVIYQRCLAIELRKAARDFVREKDQVIYYEGEQVGNPRADFIIEDNIMVELKAVVSLENVHLAQAKNYLVAYDIPTGLLLNFGGPCGRATLKGDGVYTFFENCVPRKLVKKLCK